MVSLVARMGIVQPAGKIVIDGAGGNRKDADEARDRHGAENVEHDGCAEPIGGETCEPGCGRIAGVIECLVAADPPGESGMAKDPSETAAIAGGNTTAAACAMPCEIATGRKLGKSGSDNEANVTMVAATTITSRLDRVASTSAPAGVCATMPAIVAIDMKRPILASSQCCSVRR